MNKFAMNFVAAGALSAAATVGLGGINYLSGQKSQEILKAQGYPQAKLDSVSKIGVGDVLSLRPFEVQREKLNNAAREVSTARVLDSLKIDPAVQKKILATITKFN